jgi:S1-C subfamily serine protease
MFSLTCMLTLALSADPDPKINVAQLVDRARKATVQVSGEWRRARRRSTRWGGGVIVGDRHAILTCLHVIEGYPNLIVETHDQREHGATVVATFPDRDLALLKMESDQPYPGVTVKEGTWQAGQIAIAVGFPQLHGRSILVGKIRDIRRDVVYSNVSPETPLLAFRAETSFGFSGGPLLNVYGEFVGMIVARTDDEDSLAIPASDILATLGFKQLPIPKEELWVEDEKKRQAPPSADPSAVANDEASRLSKTPGEFPSKPTNRAKETSSERFMSDD